MTAPATGARYRRPDPSVVRVVAGPAGVPLRVWTAGVGVALLTVEPAAVDELVVGLRALVLARGTGHAAAFPAVYADPTAERRFRERHEPAMAAVVVAAAGRVLSDLSRGREFELDRPALHEWFVAIGALRRRADHGPGPGPALGPVMLTGLHDRLAQVLLPEYRPVVAAGPSVPRPGWPRFGWGVVLGLVIGLMVAIGGTEPPPPRELAPEQVVPALPVPALEGLPAAAPSPEISPLHDTRVRVIPVTCVLPVLGTSNESAEAWVQAAVTCLDRTWRPMLDAAGVPWRRPVVQRYQDQIRTRCSGELRTNAFYCSADQLIGVSPSNELRQVSEQAWSGRLLGVMAHEYGHHVQALAGTLAAVETAQRAHAPGSPAWLELNRRKELQANCLAGIALAASTGRGSVGAAETSAARTRVSSGDDAGSGGVRDHGSTAHNREWFDRGLRAGSPVVCNTWIAPSADVE